MAHRIKRSATLQAFCIVSMSVASAIALAAWFAAFVVLLFLCSGCSAAGDGYSVARFTLSVPASFTPEQVAMTEDARDQWCAAKGWCPAVVVGSAGKRIEVLNDPAPAEGEAATGGHTDVSDQVIAVEQWTLDSRPDMFWLIIGHEMGHLQGIGHHGNPDCTMFWFHDEPSFDLACE